MTVKSKRACQLESI